jgi:tagatose-1,6-bisphosphate aldolase
MSSGGQLPVLDATTKVPMRAGALIGFAGVVAAAAVWATQVWYGQAALRDEVAGIKAQLAEIRADVRSLLVHQAPAPK